MVLVPIAVYCNWNFVLNLLDFLVGMVMETLAYCDEWAIRSVCVWMSWIRRCRRVVEGLLYELNFWS